MGKVSTFCTISGCSPEVPAEITDTETLLEEEECPPDLFPLFQEVLAILVDEEETRGMEDLSVIGPIAEDGALIHEVPAGGSRNQDVPDTDEIRVIRHCSMGDFWDFGLVDPPESIQAPAYLVSFGFNILIQTASLPILTVASNGWLTPPRLWRFCMKKRMADLRDGYGIPGINYGVLHTAREQFLSVFPTHPDWTAIAVLGDKERTKENLIWKTGFWGWMRPDCFPSPLDAKLLVEPSFVEPIRWSATAAARNSSRTTIDLLPVEVLLHVAANLPLSMLLAFASTTRPLRAILLEPRNRDTLAREEIRRRRPWLVPTPSEVEGEEVQDGAGPESGKLSASKIGIRNVSDLGWAYLQRSVRSPSMRNRERIWGIVRQIEEMARDMGV